MVVGELEEHEVAADGVPTDAAQVLPDEVGGAHPVSYTHLTLPTSDLV